MHTAINSAVRLRMHQTRLVLCCVSTAIVPAVASAREPLAIIEQGAGNEVIPTINENRAQSGWFALLEVGNPRLEPAHFVLRRKRKLNPANDDDVYDLWASSHRSDSTSYFLRHASLVAGPVTPVRLPNHPGTEISNVIEVKSLVLSFKEKSYVFDVKHLDKTNPTLRQITVKTIGGSSLLYDWRQHWGSTSENYEYVRWAGDLDRDGRLDLIVEFSSYYNSTTCLFLSAPAKPPSLMKRVGCWSTSA